MEREALYDLLERLWDRYDREEFIADVQRYEAEVTSKR